MKERKTSADAKEAPETGSETIEFDIDSVIPVSSGDSVRMDDASVSTDSEAADPFVEDRTIIEAGEEYEPEIETEPVRSAAFMTLAAPSLPQLKRENRARLQMQSPNRLHLYWSLKSNPYQVLNRALSWNFSSYTLAVRLLDLRHGSEELHAVDPEGSWWFNVGSNSDYRAEVGFYAPNRPFVRVIYSNTVTTPRKSPSPRPAADAEWSVPSQQFAKVLDLAGFRQDAFDVALAGDDMAASEDASRRAFARFSGKGSGEFAGVDSEELRYAMLVLASGATLEQIRFRVSERLFAILQEVFSASSKPDALDALKGEFDIEEIEEYDEEIEFGPAVFGASLMNFPQRTRRLSTRPRGFDRVSKFQPISSPARP